MPKTASTSRTRAAAASTKHDPISKPASSKPKEPKQTPSTSRTGKNSHLYTDDNPSTTIHGTGFKDRAAAERTLDLIKNRSLIYQWQTVNTMYNRAKHHPSLKKAVEGSAATKDMRDAMQLFREWLDITYPKAKAELRGSGGFKPLLSKKIVEKYLDTIEASEAVDDVGKQFARTYVELPKGKKLGNVLVDDSKPMEADWEKKRYDALDGLIDAGKEEAAQWKDDELWNGDKRAKDPSERHLKLISWAWSPLKEVKL